MNTFHPPKNFNPPRACRGALTLWPQLERAMQQISGEFTEMAGLTPSGNLPIGNALTTGQELGVSPDLFSSDLLPPTLYSQVLWAASKTAKAQAKIVMALQEVAKLIESGAPGTQTGVVVSACLTNLAGIAGKTADQIKQVDDQVSLDVAATVGASDTFNTAKQSLKEALAALENNNNQHPFSFQSAVTRFKTIISTSLEGLEMAAALMTAGSVLGNLEQALASLHDGWQTVAQQFQVDAQNPGPFEESLPEAIAQWQRFAAETQYFFQSNL